MRQTAFWDTSVLVPLCTLQAGTATATRMFSKYQAVVWWGAHVEIVSALTRLKRMGEISDSIYRTGKADASQLLSNLKIVEPSTGIESIAIMNLEKYALRAADAFQLAAAIVWCEGKPSGRVFLTSDRRLAEAAEQSGFTLEPGLVLP